MGLQFDNVTTAPENSLTLIVEDLLHARVAGGNPSAGSDWEAWLNALSRQAAPIITSSSGRAQLEAWLDVVEAAVG